MTYFLLQVISIYGQPENCTNACKEIMKVMQNELVSQNRGYVREVEEGYWGVGKPGMKTHLTLGVQGGEGIGVVTHLSKIK